MSMGTNLEWSAGAGLGKGKGLASFLVCEVCAARTAGRPFVSGLPFLSGLE